MRVALIDCGSARVGSLEAQLQGAGVGVDRIPLEQANARATWQNVGSVVISGGPHLFTDPREGEELRRQFQFVDRLTQPALGICLGHQALALAAGAEVFRGEERRKTDRIRFAAAHPLLKGLGEEEEFATDHCEGVTVPPGYVVLGRSEFYEVEAMANDSAKRYGVQFHPESSGDVGARLVENFLKLSAQ